MTSRIVLSPTSATIWSNLDRPEHDAENPLVVPVGLNFGPSTLMIVFFINGNEYHTGVRCEDRYQEVFQDALSLKVQRSPEYWPSESLSPLSLMWPMGQDQAMELVELLSKHIAGAIDEGIMSLDYNPAFDFRLMAVTVPDHWGETARTYVATAAKEAGHPLDGSHTIISLSQAIQTTFEMSRYKQGNYFTLIINYNKSHLHLMLVQMCGTDCTMIKQVYFPHLGEDEVHKVPAPSNAAASGQQSLNDVSIMDKTLNRLRMNEDSNKNYPIRDLTTSGDHRSDSAGLPDLKGVHYPICYNEAAHFKPIIDAVSDFMVSTTRKDISVPARQMPVPVYADDDVRNAVHYLKNIVIDGEASLPGLLYLYNTLDGMFMNEECVNVEGTKTNCGAIGAAFVARRQYENSKHLDDWKKLPGYEP